QKPKGSSEPEPTPATEVPEPVAAVPLDQLVERLVPSPRGKTKKDQIEPSVLRALLAMPTETVVSNDWPMQSEIAKVLHLTNVQVSQFVRKARERWRRLGGLSKARQDLADALGIRGGIASLAEAAAMVADQFGSGLPEPMLSNCSRQVLRAAVE